MITTLKWVGSCQGGSKYRRIDCAVPRLRCDHRERLSQDRRRERFVVQSASPVNNLVRASEKDRQENRE